MDWAEDADERVYLLQSTAYRLIGVGARHAIDVVQRIGLPQNNKACRVILLNNNVPQVSLYFQPTPEQPVPDYRSWQVSYDLGQTWKKVPKSGVKNSSLFKVDIVVYPELKLRNLIITQVYEVLFNLSPAVEVSLWKGMKLTGQVIFPIVNQYGSEFRQVREGYVSLSQTVRLPHNIFLTGTVGTFNNDRWGGDMAARYIFRNERFSIDARMGYTGLSRFENWRWKVSPLKRLTWSVGGNYYWTRYNTQLSLKAEQYLLGEKGVRFDLVRHFRHASIGFYGMKVQRAGNGGLNGGIRFQIALPPYKYKRHGHIPRVMPSAYWGMSYNAGNERYYGRSFNPRIDENIASQDSFNPYFIKTELLSY
ncbi:MAG: hypothetical protein LBL78_05140 [Prevotellaceae bacterium]|nr:hypothetical protein [Prevotellaceae bacterium]